MPSSFSFSLTSAPSTGTGGAFPVYPVGGTDLVCNASAFDQQHFLDLVDRIFPLEFVYPLKTNPNSGYELFQSFGAVGARVSDAIKNLECNAFIIFSSGGARASVNVSFTRPTAAAGAVTVKAGTVVKSSRHNRRFILAEDAVFGGADLGPVVALAVAEADGYEYNVTGQIVTTSGITLEGEIDTVEKFVLDPAFGDQTIEVAQLQYPTVAGKCAELDGLGSNRGISRTEGETDSTYRLRLRTLPDVVSPGAMVRAVERALAGARKPISYAFCETFEHPYQEVYDAPSPNAGTPSYDGGSPPLNPDFDDTTFVYDDPRAVAVPADFCRNRTMDELELRGAFVVVLPNDVTLVDLGMAYDDPGTQPSDFLDSTTGMRRGTPAYDITNDDNVIIMTAAYDGFDFERGPLYAGIYQTLQAIKPAGVAAIIDTIRP